MHACPCIVDRFIESESPFAPATVYGYHAGTVYNNKTRAKKDNFAHTARSSLTREKDQEETMKCYKLVSICTCRSDIPRLKTFLV